MTGDVLLYQRTGAAHSCLVLPLKKPTNGVRCPCHAFKYYAQTKPASFNKNQTHVRIFIFPPERRGQRILGIISLDKFFF